MRPSIPVLRKRSKCSGEVTDVGANIGQSANKSRTTYPSAEINCFEPIPSVFRILLREVDLDPMIHPWNFGLSATKISVTAVEAVLIILRPDPFRRFMRDLKILSY